jgi:hypothetical protein
MRAGGWAGSRPHGTVCIEVKEQGADGTPGWPQVSCFQVGDATSLRRLQASYLPPEDLQCLMATSGTGGVPSEGIVIGRVVEPDEQLQNELHPAANVQVLPTPADLPRAPIPRLAQSTAQPTAQPTARRATIPRTRRTCSTCPRSPNRRTWRGRCAMSTTLCAKEKQP